MANLHHHHHHYVPLRTHPLRLLRLLPFFLIISIIATVPSAHSRVIEPYANKDALAETDDFKHFYANHPHCPRRGEEEHWCQYSTHFQEYLRREYAESRSLPEAAERLIGESNPKGIELPPFTYSPVTGQAFGGFNSNIAHAAYLEQQEQRGGEAEAKAAHQYPILFVPGGRTKGAGTLSLAYLYHELGGMDHQLLYSVTHDAKTLTYGVVSVLLVRHAIEAIAGYTGSQLNVVALSAGGTIALKAIAGGKMRMKLRKEKGKKWLDTIREVRNEWLKLGVQEPPTEAELLKESNSKSEFTVELDLGLSLAAHIRTFIGVAVPLGGGRFCFKGVAETLGVPRRKSSGEVLFAHLPGRVRASVIKRKFYSDHACDQLDGNYHTSEFLAELIAQIKREPFASIDMHALHAVPDRLIGNCLGELPDVCEKLSPEYYTSHIPCAKTNISVHFPAEPEAPAKMNLGEEGRKFYRTIYNHTQLGPHPTALQAQFQALRLPLDAVNKLVEESERQLPNYNPPAESSKPLHDHGQQEEQ